MAIGGTNYGRLRWRQGTVAALTAANPVLANGEATSSYSSGDPVVKIGDGVRSWVDLPNIAGTGGGGGGGDGGIINTAVGSGSDSATVIVGGTFSETQPNNWLFGNDVGDCGVEGGDFGWGYDEAGFYQVGINYWVGFTGGTPELMTFELVTYWGDSWAWDVPCLGPAAQGRSFYGAQGTLLTSWHYMPDKTQTGTGENANQLVVRWPGTDATLVRGNGTSDHNAISLYIARFTPTPTP